MTCLDTVPKTHVRGECVETEMPRLVGIDDVRHQYCLATKGVSTVVCASTGTTGYLAEAVCGTCHH
jgi:hypothetical protein